MSSPGHAVMVSPPHPPSQLETSKPDLTSVRSLPKTPRVLPFKKHSGNLLIIPVQCPFDPKPSVTTSQESTARGLKRSPATWPLGFIKMVVQT